MKLEARNHTNVKQAVSFFAVANIAESLRFYVDSLGFEMARKWIDEGKLRWCWCRANNRAPILLAIILSATLPLSCSRQPQAQKTVPPTPSPAAVKNWSQVPPPIIGKPYPAKGVVTIINLQEGWVEIDHEEIDGLMPAMQMEWPVKPRSLMDTIRVGDKVEFTVVETGKGEIITQIKPVPSAGDPPRPSN